MNRLEELINKLCPKGIRFVPLWSVVNFDKRFIGVDKNKQAKVLNFCHVSAEKLKSLNVGGNVKLLSVGKFEGRTNEEVAQKVVNSGEVVTIPSGGTANIKYHDGKFVDGGNILLSSKDPNKYFLKFIYYYLLKKNDYIQSCFRGGSVQHPDMAKIVEIKIPVPPMEVQCEIVRILDNFTELTAELTARNNQFSFYREKLISSTSVTYKLKEVVDICLGLTATPNYVEKGVTFISAKDTSKDFLDLSDVKYISKEDYDKATSNAKPRNGDVLFTRVGSNLGHPVIVECDIDLCMFVSLGFMRVKNKKLLSNKYLKHWINSKHFWSQVNGKTYGAAKINLNTGWLNEFYISLPPLDEQNRIVNLLDSFETFCKDVNKGLPAEIEARQKQYEYYRDKLLTFKKLKA